MFKDLYDAINFANGTLLFRKGAIKKAEAVLYDNEKIHYACLATFSGQLIGLLVITNNRVFGHASILGDVYYQEIQIEDVRNISYTTIDKSLHIYGALCTIDCEVVNRSTLKDIKTTINKLKTSTIKYFTQTTTKLDVEELKNLKELLDSGIITQEEFNAKKKQLLNL